VGNGFAQLSLVQFWPFNSRYRLRLSLNRSITWRSDIFLNFFQVLCLGSEYTCKNFYFGSKKTGTKKLASISEMPLGDIWPRVMLNRCQKGFSASIKNWIETKTLVSISKMPLRWCLASGEIEPLPKKVFCLG